MERSIMGLIDVEAEDLGTRGTGNVEERDEMRNALVRQYPMSRVSDGDRRERDFVDRDENGLTQIWSITDSSS